MAARYRVAADDSKAKADLRQVVADKKQAIRRVSNASRRVSRAVTRAFAFTGVAATVGKFSSQPAAGGVDMISEALVPLRAAAQQFVDESLGASATARRSAREETKAAFAYTVGRTGDLAGATEFYNIASRIREEIESGRNILRQDPRFTGPSLKDVTALALKGNFRVFLENFKAAKGDRVIAKAFSYVVDGLRAD